MTRYRIGSFLVGDQISFLKSIKSNEAYKSLPVSELDRLNDIIDRCEKGDVVVKIVSLNAAPMTGGTGEAPSSFEIGIDGGGGQYLTILSLPGSLINEIERVVPEPNNVDKTVPDTMNVTYTNNPSRDTEVSDEDQEGKEENMIPTKEPVHKLPKENTKLPAATAKEVDYKKNIKTKVEVNNGKIDTVSKGA